MSRWSLRLAAMAAVVLTVPRIAASQTQSRTCTYDRCALRIENADSLTIFVAAGTNYLPDRARAWHGDLPRDIKP